MRCPKCGSSETQFIVDNQSTGPSIGWGCCGYILLGPVGLLLSLCGISHSHDEYWICNKCGEKFNKGESLETTIDKIEKKIAQKEKRISDLKRKKQEVYTRTTPSGTIKYSITNDRLGPVETWGSTYNDSQKLHLEKVKYSTKIKNEVISSNKEIKKLYFQKNILIIGVFVIPMIILLFLKSLLIAAIAFVLIGIAWGNYKQIYETKFEEINLQKSKELKEVQEDIDIIARRMKYLNMDEEIAKCQAEIHELIQQKESIKAIGNEDEHS